MNTPNKLTLFRIVIVPFFIFFLLCDWVPYNDLFAFLLFVLASLTDAADGRLARKRHLVTDFGKLMDPLADKILVMSALLCFVELRLAGAVMVIIILAREFLVTSLRMIGAAQGTVIAANVWGKAKTISQLIAILVTLFFLALGQFVNNIFLIGYFVSQTFLWVCTVLTFLSGVIYLWQYRRFLHPFRHTSANVQEAESARSSSRESSGNKA